MKAINLKLITGFILFGFIQILISCTKDDKIKKEISCSGDCDNIQVEITGETGQYEDNISCQNEYEGGLISSRYCTGTRKYLKSGNKYSYSVDINYSTCEYLITVDGIGSCGNKDNISILDTISDIEGNIYHSIAIGSQIWLLENLITTKFNDGTDIPVFIDPTTWSELKTPAFNWFGFDHSKKSGMLYNWYAINSGQLCPTGWHIPSNNEWTTLVDYLGGNNVAGGKMKKTDTVYWDSPNTGATNESGFTAFPNPVCNENGYTLINNQNAIWWSSTERDSTNALCLGLSFTSPNSFQFYIPKVCGLSVRCIKD